MRDSRINGPNSRETLATERRTVFEAEDRPISQILQDILSNVQEIVRSEVRLTRTEIGEEISKATRAGVFMATGGILAAYAVGFFLWSATFALREILPVWLAPLLVGLAVAIFAAVFIVVGRNRMKLVNTKPEKTIASVKEDVQWVKDQTR